MIAVKPQKPILEKEIAIGRFVFYQNIIVGEVNEGEHSTFENAKEIFNLAEEIYGNDNRFIYISHRINSYSVDPFWFIKAKIQLPNCKAFVLVADKSGKEKFAKIEKMFIKSKLVMHDNLENAIAWADEFFAKKGD